MRSVDFYIGAPYQLSWFFTCVYMWIFKRKHILLSRKYKDTNCSGWHGQKKTLWICILATLVHECANSAVMSLNCHKVGPFICAYHRSLFTVFGSKKFLSVLYFIKLSMCGQVSYLLYRDKPNLGCWWEEVWHWDVKSTLFAHLKAPKTLRKRLGPISELICFYLITMKRPFENLL